MGIHSDSHDPEAGLLPVFGDNLVGDLSEEDGVDQSAEPPSWLPNGPLPRTSAGADLRSPATDEDDSQAPADEDSYEFTGDTSYTNGKDRSFDDHENSFGDDHANEYGMDRYSYSSGSSGDAATQVPPYPAQEYRVPDYSATLPGPRSGSVTPDAEHTIVSEPAGNAALGSPPGAGPLASTGVPAGDDLASNTGSPEEKDRTSTFAVRRRNKPAAAGPAASQAQGRRADLVIARLEPWSVMKFSFLMSLVAWVVLFIAVALLYFVLSALGVFDSVQHTLASVTSSSGSSGVNLGKWFAASRILGYTMLIGAVNIVLITALSTVGAMIYNLVTHLGGGIEVTLRETD